MGLRRMEGDERTRIHDSFAQIFEDFRHVTRSAHVIIRRWVLKNERQGRFPPRICRSIYLKSLSNSDLGLSVCNQGRDEFFRYLPSYLDSIPHQSLSKLQHALEKYWPRRLEILNEYDNAMVFIDDKREKIRRSKNRALYGSKRRPILKKDKEGRLPLSHPVRPAEKRLTTNTNTKRSAPAHRGAAFSQSRPSAEYSQLADWLEVQQALKGQRRDMSHRTTSRLGPLVTRRYFPLSIDNDRAPETEGAWARYESIRKDCQNRANFMARGKGPWNNFPILLDLDFHSDEQYLEALKLHMAETQLAFDRAEGIGKVQLAAQIRSNEVAYYMNRELHNFRINQRFLQRLTFALSRSPHALLRSLYIQSDDLRKGLKADLNHLSELRRIRSDIVINPRAAHMALVMHPIQQLLSNVHIAYNITWIHVSHHLRRARFSGYSEHLIPYTKSSIKFSRYLADWSPFLAIPARRTAGCGTQSIHSAFHFYLMVSRLNAVQVCKMLTKWLHATMTEKRHFGLRKHKRALSDSVVRLETLSADVKRMLDEKYLNLFSRRLDLMNVSEVQFREAAAVRLWESYWRNQREYEDGIEKIDADLRKAKQARDTARNQRSKGQKKKKKKRSKRLKNTHDMDRHGAA